MWQYLPNVQQPHKKQKLTDTDKRDKGRAYDKEKRKRNFQPLWKNGREWLQYTSDVGMQCSWCQEFASSVDDHKSVFVVGCSNFKLESVVAHERSEQHQRASGKKRAQLKPDTPMGKCVQQMHKNVFHRLVHLFRNVHALVKYRRPFTDFVWMCQLDEKKGLDVGQTYRNDKQAATFSGFIAEIERQKLVSDINNSKFLTIICDGSTDSGVQEEEIVYVRYCNSGEINTSFVALGSPERADADGIFKVISDSLNNVGIKDWHNKLVGVGSDGANVMTGKKGGVVAKWKQLQPLLQGVHCFAHRLELAFKDVVKNINYYSKMSTLLMGLYYFYHNSSLNRENLKRSYTALKITPLMPSRVGGTRWLGHMERALETFWTGYTPIRTHLQQVFKIHFLISCK